MSFAIKITKPGYDVLEETDPRNFSVHSGYNHLKTVRNGYGSFQQSVNNVTEYLKTIAHGLSYKPLVIGYFRNTANSNWFICSADPVQTAGRLGINADVSLYVDDTNVYFNLYNYTGGTITFEIKYEFFYEGDV